MKKDTKNIFMIGCNYWASNAGTEMWRNWDEETVRKDIKVLSENGVEYMRVFPNWADFQPAYPLLVGGTDAVNKFVNQSGEYFDNPYYLDKEMLKRFGIMCDICSEYDVKLVVGIITGFMSGRKFIPPALYGKNLISDPLALYMQQKFVEGIVKEFKDKPAIYAWDLGNECNNLSGAKGEIEAKNWTMTVSNAIRAFDSSRPVVSGMHSLLPSDSPNKPWTIEGQAEGCDILTTHPYPYWVMHAHTDKNISLRTAMHSTCQTKFYSEVGNRPCLVEEVGTMGPMLCNNENSADFMRLNLLSNWVNGALGVMWWCANDQTNLWTEPYLSNMCEVELGMLDVSLKPKPVLKETKRIGDIIKSFDFNLPKAEVDAVCVLTRGQDQWGVAYMTYILARQAGLNISFCYGDGEIPIADNYIMPSVCGPNVMPRTNFEEIKKRVKNGAKLYMSVNNGIIAQFEELFGLQITDSSDCQFSSSIKINDGNGKDVSKDIPIEKKRFYYIDSKDADVVAYDKEGNPEVFENSYGEGKVCFVNFPLEMMLLDKCNAFEDDYYLIYKKLFSNCIDNHIVVSQNNNTCVTIHKSEDNDTVYAAIINYSDKEQEPNLVIKDDYKINKVVYAANNENPTDKIPSFDGVILELKKI